MNPSTINEEKSMFESEGLLNLAFKRLSDLENRLTIISLQSIPTPEKPQEVNSLLINKLRNLIEYIEDITNRINL